MANFIFKKEDVKVYVVYNNLQYRIDINGIEFSQTFKQASYNVSTLHSQDYFQGSVINTANPVTWSLNTPLLQEATNRVVFDRLIDVATFDLYISTKYDDFKLEKCFIQDGSFEIEGSKPLRLSISGEASKLSTYTGTIPGVAQNTGITTSTYMLAKVPTLTVGSTRLSPLTLKLELQNETQWNKYDTVNGAVDATNAATSMYPSEFVIGKRVLAGAVGLLSPENSTERLTWNNGTSVELKVGTASGTFYGIHFNSNNCSFTNRLKTGDIFQEEYSWRMLQNPTSLSSVLTYTTQ